MEDSTFWWLMAGVAVAAELVTGTFYLVMFALGLAAAALTAHAGGSLSAQMVVAALVGGGAVAGWYLVRSRRAARAAPPSGPGVHLDIGETVHVERWESDGTAVVRYRGANWTVQPAEGEPQYPGAYRVREVVGSRLVVEKI